MNTTYKGAARGTSTSEKSPFFSTGFVAPLNLNFSTGDPLAGFKASAALEPYVVIRQPLGERVLPRLSEAGATPDSGTRIVTPENLGWSPAFTQQVKSSLDSFAEEWSDPTMDVYDLSETR